MTEQLSSQDRTSAQPTVDEPAYYCPLCGVYAHQRWYWAAGFDGRNRTVSDEPVRSLGHEIVSLSKCAHCGQHSIWCGKKLVYPDTPTIAPPNPDLADDIQQTYSEAAQIVNKSPRAAAALLRLCVQKLCIQLGQDGHNLNDDIAALVKEGLPVRIQQALDVLRVVGNNAVHPGQIDLKDDRQLANKLFGLVNLIADNQITQPKAVQAMFDDLPDGAQAAVRRRDGS